MRGLVPVHLGPRRHGPAGGLGLNWMTLLAEWLRGRADGKPLASERMCVHVAGRQHVRPA